MGIVRMGVPEDIVTFIKNQFNISSFIETGTFKGETAAWATNFFNIIHTIEFSKKIFINTKNNYSHISNINFLFGDSRKILKDILPESSQSIIWLDAHWCASGSYGETDQCPLIEEINLINSFDKDHFILIDDARLFLAPPPLPNSTKYYPDITELIIKLNNGKRKIYVFEDVIIAVPEFAAKTFQPFMQNKTTLNWRYPTDKLAHSKWLKSKYHLKEILQLWL